MLGIFGVYIKLLFLILGITALIFIVLDAFVCFKKDSGEPLFYDSLSSSTKDEDKKKEVSLSAYSENVEREVKIFDEDEYFQAPPDNEEDLESLQKSFLAVSNLAVSNIKTVEKEKEVSSIEQNIEETIDYSQLIEDCQDEIIFGISDYENVDLI